MKNKASLSLMQAAATPDYKGLYESSQLRIVKLEQELTQLKKLIFASRHERFVPTDPSSSQLSLGIEAQATGSATVVDTREISYTRTIVSAEQKPLQHPGRTKLPEHLRREEIIIDPAADITGCKKMGEEITEVLEYEPGELFVKKYVRYKYARPAGGGIVIGELPSRPLEKAIAGPGLLAQIVIDKYVDHLPLYRQMQRFDRSGVKLSYSTLTDWVSSTCKLIEPLFEALKKEVLASNYLHVDETPIRVLDKDKKGETHRGYYWVYQNSINKTVFFDYQEGRGREGPIEVLKSFQGHLQTDGYGAYDIFDERAGIMLMHCMAHARRMFHEALENDAVRAKYVLGQLQLLYAIERQCQGQDLSFEKITDVRKERSVPILNALGEWMKKAYVEVTPKSLIGKALAYSIERWEKLSIYTNNGMLKIDNNPVENSIRPVALGRKNYLFAGSHEAARRSGMLYSLLGTCKMHSIEPTLWLRGVLQIIADHPIDKISELLPRVKVSE